MIFTLDFENIYQILKNIAQLHLQEQKPTSTYYGRMYPDHVTLFPIQLATISACNININNCILSIKNSKTKQLAQAKL